MSAINLPEETVMEHIACSHAALDQAKQAMDKQAAKQREAEGLISQVADALVGFERIDPQERVKAAEMLKDHATTLRILLKTADVNDTIRPRPMGGPEKKASAPAYNSLNDPYVGRRTSEKKESDFNYERHFNVKA